MKNISKLLKKLHDRMDTNNPYDRSYREELFEIMLGIQEGWAVLSSDSKSGFCEVGIEGEQKGEQDGGVLRLCFCGSEPEIDYDLRMIECTNCGVWIGVREKNTIQELITFWNSGRVL